VLLLKVYIMIWVYLFMNIIMVLEDALVLTYNTQNFKRLQPAAVATHLPWRNSWLVAEFMASLATCCSCYSLTMPSNTHVHTPAGDFSRLLDISRFTIECSNPDLIASTLEAVELEKHLSLLRLKNRLDLRLEAPGGYRDTLSNIFLKGQEMIFELQVALRTMVRYSLFLETRILCLRTSF
jgi:hypothetical protein